MLQIKLMKKSYIINKIDFIKFIKIKKEKKQIAH